MYTIGQLLESNLTSRKQQKNKTGRSRTHGHRIYRLPSNGTGLLSFNIELDKTWQKMWETHDEASVLLDQIF